MLKYLFFKNGFQEKQNITTQFYPKICIEIIIKCIEHHQNALNAIKHH